MWIELTVAAAFLQNVRSGLQKRLKSDLSTTGATFVRFGFGLPFALLYLLALRTADHAVPPLNLAFVAYAVFGALAQIAGTVLLVIAFSYRNFMAATVYSKTEPIIAAIFGYLLLGDRLGPIGLIAIGTGLIGVFVLSIGEARSWRTIIKSSSWPSVAIGLSSGFGFAMAAIGVRGAALSLGESDVLVAASVTLACVLALQTVLMIAYMAAFERRTFAAILSVWPLACLTGLCGALASIGWFTAMAMEPVALVKTVGQIELVFAYIASLWWFREHVSRLELAGCGLVIAAVCLLIGFG